MTCAGLPVGSVIDPAKIFAFRLIAQARRPMKLGIMQPYLFPYIGYWQLIDCVDEFVIMEDLNYIKQGYINRNTILVNGKEYRFIFELKGASQNKLINEIEIGNNGGRILKTIEINYKKAPQFQAVFPLLKSVIEYPENNLAKYISNSIVKISEFLGMDTKIISSCDIERDHELKAQDMVLDICKSMHASSYINAIGGTQLYSKDDFKENGVDLFFLKTGDVRYTQTGSEFIPNLSIIDVMMFNSIEETRDFLRQYELV
jgi:hypothetical protein